MASELRRSARGGVAQAAGAQRAGAQRTNLWSKIEEQRKGVASYQGPASSKRLDISSAAELETRDLSDYQTNRPS